VHDGPSDEWDAWAAFFHDPRVRFVSTRDRNEQYGHPIREMVLTGEDLSARYVHMTNCDNYLVPTAVATINAQTADVVAWPLLHNYFDYNLMPARLQVGAIDLSSLAVRSDLAKEIGFPWRENAADWLWVQEIMKRTADWKFLDAVMGVHN
jgi:hypothetical protein